MNNQKKPNPMYFASLKLESVRCFGEEQVLDLRDSEGAISPWTLILGDNGVGKTTLLKCLAWMVPVELPEDRVKAEQIKTAKRLKDAGFDFSIIKDATGISKEELQAYETDEQNENEKNDDEKVEIKPLMDNFEEESAFDSIIRFGKDVVMNVQAQFTNGLNLRDFPSESDFITIGIRLKREGNKLQDIENTDHLTTAKLPEFNSPNLFAYGAGRHMASENFEKSELKDPTYNLLSDSADLYDAEQVLLNLYNASIQEEVDQFKSNSATSSINETQKEILQPIFEGKATKLYRKVKEILTELLPYIESPDSIIVNQAVNKDGTSNTRLVEIKTPFGQVGLYDLSLGYKTMLAWVVDLAIRMLWRNPESGTPLEEPAVVIVDEIDLHLHPKWQRSIKKYLTRHFPNTQFICTAHSPFMAQAAETKNLSILHEARLYNLKAQVRIQNNPTIVRGWHIGQVVTNLFGLPEISWEIEEQLINKRRVLLDKTDRTPQDVEELEKLDDQILNLPGLENEEDQRLLTQIRKTAELLRKKGGLL